jgi:molecular chaperone GrpE
MTLPPDSPHADIRAQLGERTADLQRVQAEYDNYRKRVRRDRLAVREVAVANVLRELLPVLDIIEPARGHGGTDHAFETVAQALEKHLAALGLQTFGEPGELFDPRVHEALSVVPSAEVDQAVCGRILRPGYRVGEQLLSPAQVIVAEPADVHRPGR